MKAFIFAAGLGTRLKPLTDTMPKALVPIAGKPLLEHLILKMKRAGFDEIVINVHHFAGQIIDFLAQKQNFGIRIHISDERQMLLETGGGIKHAAHLFASDEPILIHNVDILSNVDFAQFYKMHAKDSLATLLVSKRQSSRYFLFDEQNRLKGWTNLQTSEVKTPYESLNIDACQRFAFAGIHVVSPTIFDLMAEWHGAFSIVDFYLALAKRENIFSVVKNDLQLLDVGKISTLQQAESFLEIL